MHPSKLSSLHPCTPAPLHPKSCSKSKAPAPSCTPPYSHPCTPAPLHPCTLRAAAGVRPSTHAPSTPPPFAP
eukprot:3058915-Prymnesium_polylepis.2